MKLTEFDRALVDQALVELLTVIQEGIPSLQNTSADAINQNTLAIAAVKHKISSLPKEGEFSCTLQELKMVYWALTLCLDDTKAYLDDAPLSDPDREYAISVQSSCNGLLRSCREQFSQAGIDIRAQLGM